MLVDSGSLKLSLLSKNYSALQNGNLSDIHELLFPCLCSHSILQADISSGNLSVQNPFNKQ